MAHRAIPIFAYPQVRCTCMFTVQACVTITLYMLRKLCYSERAWLINGMARPLELYRPAGRTLLVAYIETSCSA